MENDALIVEVVQFVPTKQCLTDPSLFQALREIVERWQEKGMKGQYWGTAVEKPYNIHWILLWQSRAQAASFAADPLYPEFVQRRQSLATTPVGDLHVALSGKSDPPQLCVEAPITEIDTYTVLDNTHIEDAHKAALSTMRGVRSLRPSGFNGCSTGVTDDPTVGVYFTGWNSVEEHMRLGMEEGHENVREVMEEAMLHLGDLTMTHVAFSKHNP